MNAARDRDDDFELTHERPCPFCHSLPGVAHEPGCLEKQTTDQKKRDALWAHVEKFIADNDISCGEAIYQADRVILNAYEFIEGCANIVGYVPVPADD